MAPNSVAPPDTTPVRMLAVSFAFPPLAYPRSIQVARLVKYRSARTVMVCADEGGARRDPTLEPDAESRLDACLRVPFTVSRSRRLADRLAHRLHRPLWNRWNRAPDRYGAWKRAALAAVEAHALGHGYVPDLVSTFSQPAVDHLIGLELKKKWGRPWVAHFSDPWADNPFHKADEATTARNLALEHEVVEAADRLIFTSQETVEMVMSKYPAGWRDKARALPQCFDPVLYPPRGAPEDGALRVRYVGNFYGTRTPEPLLRSLAALHSSDPAALDRVFFELVGVTDPNIVEACGVGGLPAGLVSVRPPVGYRESLRLMTEADGLLIIDAPADVSVFLPSKLIDYVGAGRPVLGLTPRGAAAHLIARLGGWVVDPSDAVAGAAALRSFLDFLRRRREEGGGVWGDPDVRRDYEAAHLADQFEKTCRELLG